MALRSYDGALLIVTHDRSFMRCVVEGENAHKRPWDPDAEDDEEEESEDSEEEGLGKQKGVLYRLAKGQLKVLEGGMRQYEEIASRASSRLTKVAVINVV
jgi:ATPase subunit of ABC transporter with duplicated ATPase domains